MYIKKCTYEFCIIQHYISPLNEKKKYPCHHVSWSKFIPTRFVIKNPKAPTSGVYNTFRIDKEVETYNYAYTATDPIRYI